MGVASTLTLRPAAIMDNFCAARVLAEPVIMTIELLRLTYTLKPHLRLYRPGLFQMTSAGQLSNSRTI